MKKFLSLYLRLVTLGISVALVIVLATALLLGCITQPVDGLTGQDGGLNSRYHDIELLAGPRMGGGTGGG